MKRKKIDDNIILMEKGFRGIADINEYAQTSLQKIVFSLILDQISYLKINKN